MQIEVTVDYNHEEMFIELETGQLFSVPLTELVQQILWERERKED